MDQASSSEEQRGSSWELAPFKLWCLLSGCPGIKGPNPSAGLDEL